MGTMKARRRSFTFISILYVLAFCSVLLFTSYSASAAQSTATSTAEATAAADAIVAQVQKVDGNKVTAVVGALEQKGMGERPSDMPEGEAPPEKPGGDGTASSQKGEAPADKGTGSTGTPPTGTPPEKPSSDASADTEKNEKPENGGGLQFVAGEKTITFTLTDSTAITVEFLQGSQAGTAESVVKGAVLEVVLDEANNATSLTVKNLSAGGGFGGSGTVNQGTAANTIDTDGAYTSKTYTSTGDDENALRIVDATVTLKNSVVKKTAGATSNTEDGDFYGMNAGLLATDGANVKITGAKVTTSAQNGNAVFSYGTDTAVTISDSTITTTKDNSGGIHVTGGGTLKASNLTVSTAGASAAAIRSDRGGGTMVVDGGKYTTTGLNSPAIYSTADVSVSNATLTAKNSEALVIEGKNTITLVDSTVSGNMSDSKGASSSENVHNIMIYQSMSGDADMGTSKFSMTGGTLTNNNGDMIYVTNTHSIITLSGVKIVNKEKDGYLLLVSGNSASRGWGTAGANGAQVELTADAQVLAGDIAVDTVSTLNLTLSNSSSLTGSINIIENAQKGKAVEGNAVVSIEKGSTWKLTGNSSVSSLDNKGAIDYNGYTITLADGTVMKG